MKNLVAYPKEVGGRPVHPAANMFPLMRSQLYRALVCVMKGGGFDPAHPILIGSDGSVVDGRARLSAAIEAGVEPTFVVLGDDDDPFAAAFRGNYFRRGRLPKEAAALICARVCVELGLLYPGIAATDLQWTRLASKFAIAARTLRRAVEVTRLGDEAYLRVVYGGASLQDELASPEAGRGSWEVYDRDEAGDGKGSAQMPAAARPVSHRETERAPESSTWSDPKPMDVLKVKRRITESDLLGPAPAGRKRRQIRI